MRRCPSLLWGLAVLALAGCATVPTDPAARAAFEANHDPWEPMNRRIFAFNQGADRVLIRPVAEGYRRVLPPEVRDGLRHFLDNLKEPLVTANCLLQWRPASAGRAGARFVVNSTVGIVGVIDVASRWKLPPQTGDFGQTLAVWGVPEGPYLVIPLFGPSSPRDGVGKGADIYLDPLRYIPAHEDYPTWFTVGRVVADGVDERARNIDSLDEIKKESIDYYASLRSLYRQNRAAEIKGTKGPAAPTPPADFYDDPGK